MHPFAAQITNLLAAVLLLLAFAIAAMPGSVSVACSIDSSATRNIRLAASARTEITPNSA